MKIHIGTFELAGAGELSPDSLRINAKRSVQIGQCIRAEAARPFNRKNTQTTVSFSVTRSHADMMAAHVYMLWHEVSIPGSGNVRFTGYNQNGAETVFYFTAGSLDTTDASHTGLTTFHSYTLIGGRLTDKEPEI